MVLLYSLNILFVCLLIDRIQSEIPVSDWRVSASAETEPAETSRSADVKQSKESDSVSSSLFTLKMHLRRSSSAGSCTTDNLSSSKQSNMGGWYH